MKKALGPLGSVAAVALIVTAGLVGFAGPAQADRHGEELCGESPVGEEWDFEWEAEGDAEANAAKTCAEGLDFSHYKVYSYGISGSEKWYWKAWGSISTAPTPEDSTEPVQVISPPAPCWSGEAGSNCPVGGALRFAAPRYAMVGVPVTM